MLRAIVFDLDGVLIDSEPLMRFAFEAVYRDFIGGGTPPIESYLEHMGESFPRIMDKLGLPHTLWEPYRALCQRHVDHIRLFPGSRDFLERASAVGLQMGILTGKDRLRTLQILEHFDLGRFFQVVVASDELRNPKPHPEGILCVLDRLGCRAAEALMVGDSVNDILCAQQAGVKAAAVTWGIKPERLRTLCRPDYLASDWGSLWQFVLDMGGDSGAPREPAAV
ncbi:MAG TPA: HAD-IA family hydrolase [Pyrinomonadaceae bacterium]|jgi:3-amino-5-hydroxybenzoic acid synthesis related protein